MDTKVCGHCKVEKDLGSFNVNRSKKNYAKGVYPVCKSCQSKKSKESYKRHKAKRNQSSRSYHLSRNYGLTLDEFHALVEKQGQLCACCGEKQDYKRTDGKRQHLFVDHCHKTGEVRGLLCGRCNSGIGLLGDTAEHVKKAVEYLEKRIKDV